MLYYNQGKEGFAMDMEIRDILRNRRLEMHLTLKQIADAVGVSEGTVSRWES